MPDVILRFQARYPRVRVKNIHSNAGNVIEAVTSGQANLGGCFARNLQPNIEFLPLVGDVFVATCRRDNPLTSKKV